MKKEFPKTAEELLKVLPTQVKVNNVVSGVYLNSDKSNPKGIGFATFIPFLPTSIPVGTIVDIKENPKVKNQIQTNYKVADSIVLTTPKELLGNVDFVQVKVNEETAKEETKKDEIQKKGMFSAKNILIGLGVSIVLIVAGFVIYKKTMKPI